MGGDDGGSGLVVVDAGSGVGVRIAAVPELGVPAGVPRVAGPSGVPCRLDRAAGRLPWLPPSRASLPLDVGSGWQ